MVAVQECVFSGGRGKASWRRGHISWHFSLGRFQREEGLEQRYPKGVESRTGGKEDRDSETVGIERRGECQR